MNEAATSAALAAEFARNGAFDQAAQAYRRVLEQSPQNFEALLFLGHRELRTGRTAEGIALLKRACTANPRHAAAPVALGRAYLESGDNAAALIELDRALAINESLPAALLSKGVALQRLGRAQDAAAALYAALSQTRQFPGWANSVAQDPRLRQLSTAATAATRECRHVLLHDCLEPVRARYGREALQRIEACIAIYLGETKAEYPHPQQKPTFLFIPGLPAQPFYEDHSAFPWFDELETATDDIRDELIQAMHEDAGFRPVVTGAQGMAADYWHGVNDSMNWNGLYFYRHGERIAKHCELCPKTAALLDRLPLVREPGHSPEAHFSVLLPGAHIPIHTGVVNARIVVHLPLIIPPDCAIRIAGEIHGWREGECLAFDDTFEHEAWNRSGETRVILILDTWNPHLTPAEREGFSAVVQAISGNPLLSIKAH